MTNKDKQMTYIYMKVSKVKELCEKTVAKHVVTSEKWEDEKTRRDEQYEKHRKSTWLRRLFMPEERLPTSWDYFNENIRHIHLKQRNEEVLKIMNGCEQAEGELMYISTNDLAKITDGFGWN